MRRAMRREMEQKSAAIHEAHAREAAA
jgi:hypothetical protein